MSKEEIQQKIQKLEDAMQAPDFWSDKDTAQRVVQEYQDAKAELEGIGKYDRGGATLSILAGAGGTDAEDFARILLSLYMKYIENKGWQYVFLHENKNDYDGYRNITLEVLGKNVYGTLKNESGVHRLVRISPFNTQDKRHTSFALVEIVPKLENQKEIEIDPSELDMQFTRSSGPGGQNVNKRETAVRILHTPTNISVHVDFERSQQQNKEKALELLRGKLYRKQEEDRKKKERGLSISATTDIEWGSQIRSYVFHPYQMVKDHRTNAETRNVDAVLDGDIDLFIEAEKDL
jgi:peptide chain release factor 2